MLERRVTRARTLRPPPLCVAGATVMVLLACLMFPTESVRTQTTAPGGVTGDLKVWLKADAGVTGTSPVTAWNDQSGNGNHATIQLGTPSQTLTAGGLNFNPAVTFAGTGGLQGVFSVPVTSNNVSAFIVMKPGQAGSASARAWSINLDGQPDSNNVSSAILFYRISGTSIRTHRANVGLGTLANVFDKAGVFATHFKAGNQQVSAYNGTAIAPVAFTTTAFNANRFSIGVDPSGTTPLAGDIAEAVLYTTDQAVAGTEARIVSYLALKYGITLSHNYIASDNTTMFWDQTANAGYTNNIAGIGRDDGSGLVQRQSRSSNTSDLLTIGLGTIAASNAAHGGSFGVNRQVLMWGDNGASDGFETSITPPVGVLANRRMPRIWRVDETAGVGQVKLALPVVRANGETVYVVVSGDDTFDGADQWIPLTAFTGGTTNYVAADVDFTDGQYFTFATDQRAPGGVVAGLSLWLKANAGTPVDGANNFVNGAGWQDLSGRGRNASIVTSDPQRAAARINFNPSVVFDGNDYLQFGASPFVTPFAAAEVFSVAQANNAVGLTNNNPYDLGGGFNPHYVWSNTVVYNDFGTTVRFAWNPLTGVVSETKGGAITSVSGPAVDPRTYHIYATHSAAGNWGVHYDGFDVATAATSTVSFALTAANEMIGGANAGAWNGEMPEIVLYNRTLTAPERQKVNTYLALKYGVTQLSPAAGPQDYLSSVDGVIWSGTANAAYHRNVAGIGRDDGSALDQRQSQSLNTANAGNLITLGLGAIAADNASNPNTFTTDQSFLVWGDDGADTTELTVPVTSTLFRLTRIWRVQETGTVGAVTVRIPRSAVRGTSPALIRSADPTFDGSDSLVPLIVNGAHFEATLDFTSGELFTFAADPLPSPGGVRIGLVAWQKANVAGATSALWPDASGNLNDATQPAATLQPAFVGGSAAGAVNFNPAFKFDGANDGLDYATTLGIGGTADFSSVFAFRMDATVDGALLGYPAAAGNGHFLALAFPGSNFRVAVLGQATNCAATSSSAPAVGRPAIGSAVRGSSTMTVRLDGGATVSVVCTASIIADLRRLGNRAANFTNGAMPEFIQYSRALSTTELQRVHSYVAVKYGVTLEPATDYLDSTASVIWTAAANAGYTNNIAGIGRDDESALDQRQSQSANVASFGNLVTIGHGTIAADNVSNANAFGADRTFMIWGDSGASIVPATPVAGSAPGTKRMARVWKVQETGTVGSVRLRIPIARLPGTSPVMIRSTDPTFAGGNTFVPLTVSGSSYEGLFDFASGDVFTFASMLPAPGGVVGGLEYWIRPEDMAVSAGVVTNWDDVYQQHTNEVHNGGGFAVEAGFNFHPTAASNSNRYMSFNGQQLLSGAPAGDVFYMLESTGAHNLNDGYPSEFGGGGSAATWEYDYSDSQVYSGWGSTVRKVWNPLVAPAGGPARDVLDPHVYNVLSAPGEWTARFDGLTNFTTAANAVQFDSSPSGNTYIGASHISVFRGRLSEVIVYRRALSTVERQRVQSYVATKFGVTLGTPASPIDYLASDGTTVYWAGSAAYQNNIAGIGRDDLGGLNQKQSRSVNTANGGNLVTIGLGSIAADNATNSNTFPADNSFMVWGDDAGSPYLTIPFSGSGAASGTKRLTRVWRVQETGTVGSAQVRVPQNALLGTNQIIIRSTDPTFAGATTVAPLTLTGSAYETTLDFTGGEYFTFAAVPLVAPGGVAGLQLWLKADAGTTVNASNNFVNGSGWLDQSGFGRHANIVTGDPQVVTAAPNAINFNPSVGFDGNDYFRFTGGPFVNAFTAGEVFTVLRDLSVGVGNHGHPFDFGGHSTGAYTWGDSNIYEDFGTTDRLGWNPATQVISSDGKPGVTAITGPSVNVGLYHVYAVHSAVNAWGVRFDGFTAAATTTNAINFVLPAGNEHVGARSGGIWHGLMPEIFLYDRTLTEAERQRVNSYLGIKYGITQLAPGAGPQDYLSAAGTAIWNGIANSAYHTDVAGIGRDDVSALNQKQSQSINAGSFVAIGLGSIAATNQANANTFAADGSFLVWGRDAGALSVSVDVTGGLYRRLGRVWCVQETGTVGSVLVRIPVGYLSGRNQALIHSADAAFDDTDPRVPLVRVGQFYQASVDFTATEHFTFGAIPYEPGGVGGEALWIKANDGLLADTDNGNPTHVAEWIDQSGSGNTTTELRAAPQAHTDAIAPTADIVQVPIGINFNPAVDFTGASGKSLKANAASDWDAGPLSIFAVAIREGAPAAVPAALFAANGSWTGGTAGAGITATSTSYGLDGSGCLTASTTSPITYPRLVRGLYAVGGNGNGGTTRLDGASEATGTSCPTAATTFFEIGGRTAGTGALDNRIFNGKIAEVVVYKSTLSIADTDKVESYLAIKYGITLNQTPARSYVDALGATIWDASLNVTYRHNIAGLGRDDLSGLDQRQSRSSSAGDFVTIGHGAIAVDNLSNTNSFAADKTFLIWGHDGASSSWGTPVSGTALQRIARVWRAQETGTAGSVVVRIPRTVVGVQSPMLLRSVDATFDGGDTQVPMIVNGANLEATIDLASGDYFTFASETAPAPLNAGDGLVTEGHIKGLVLNTPMCPAYLWQHVPSLTTGMTGGLTGSPGGTAINIESTWVADVTGDAIPDLVHAQENQGIAVWRGNGDGTFAPIADVTSITSGFTVGHTANEATFMADLNGDAALDLISVTDGIGVSANSGTRVWLGNGDGTFATTAIVDLGGFVGTLPGGVNILQAGYSSVEITFLVDVNSDGRADILWVHDGNGVSANAGVWTWLGNGDGTFQHTPIVDSGAFTGTPPLSAANTIQAGYSANESTHAGDFNGDGRIDILWVYDGGATPATSGTWFWAGNGNGTFSHTFVADQGTFTAGPSGANRIQAGNAATEITRTADVNNDGRLDVVWASGAAPTGIWVWLGSGSGTFGHTPTADSGAFSSFNAGVSANKDNFIVDLNGDGALDFVYVSDGAGGAGTAGVYAYLAVDTDADGAGDLVDADDDNDAIADASDSCPVPGSIGTGLQLWLKADAGTTVDTSSNVVHWADQSPFARDASVVAGDPQKADAAVSFNPTVRLDGDDFFRFGKSPFVTGFTAGEAFAVVKNNAASTTVNGFPYDFGSGSRPSHYTHSNGGGSIYDGFGTTDRLAWNPLTGAIVDAKAGVGAIVGPAFATQDYHVYSSHSAAGDWGVSVDGLARATSATNTVNFTLSGSNELVGHNSLEGLTGEVAEVILYNRTLSTVEREEVNSYLATKYGITLGHSYRASDDTAIYWDMTANAAHHNNVAGIGRDDGATLNQRQSISINPGSIVAIGLGTLVVDNPTHPNSFATDRTFMMWGDDNASTGFDAVIAGPLAGMANRRMSRVWKIQETGAVGSVMVGVPESLGTGSTVYLVVSNDQTFDGTDTWMPLSTFAAGATSYLSTTLDFTNGQFFTFATVIHAPGGVTGMALWVKANDGPSATTDGANVDVWADRSGASKDLAVMDVTKSVQPTYKAVALNFNPAISLLNDATSDQGLWNENFLGVDDTINYNIDGSVFFAHIPRKTADCNTLAQLALPGADHPSMGHCANNSHQLFGTNDFPAANTTWFSGAGLTAPPDVPAISGYTWRYNALNSFFFRNNGAAAANAITPSHSGRDFYLMRDADDNVNDGAGEMSEAVMYTRQLTPLENQKVESYLAIKYGVTLSQATPTNYLSSTNRIIWNAAPAGVYNQNIAGIGRDDASALIQRQSRSVNSAAVGDLVTIGLGTIAEANVSNANNFAADDTFLVWSDDGGAATFTGSIVAPTGTVEARLLRTWFVQESGVVGAARIGVPFGTGGGASVYLVVSNDPVFDGSDVWRPLAPHVAGTAIYLAADVDFVTGQYFTFATVVPEDHGDAPASYGTTLATDGPRHVIGGYDIVTNTAPLMLGTRVEPEADGLPSATADGDDAAGVDDEDGVVFPVLSAGQPANLTVTVTNSGPAAQLSAWADWNGNGSFSDVGEQFAADLAIVDGGNAVPVSVPPSAAGTVVFRFRLSTQAGLAATGAATDGEVEDYVVAITRATNVAIAKTDGRTSYVPGAAITYTIAVTNAGFANAIGVGITDAVPPMIAITSVNCTASVGSSCGTNATSGNNVALTGASVLAGAGHQLTLTIQGTVSASMTGDLTNTAVVTAGAGQTDPDTTNNQAIDTDTQGASETDLDVTKVGPATVMVGDNVTYILTITNQGPSIATNVVVTDPTPAGLTFVSTGTGCTTPFPCALGTMNPGEVRQVSATYLVPPGYPTATPIQNTASVSGTEIDPGSSNNSRSATTIALPTADVDVTKTVDNATPLVGQTITFTITVHNHGPSDATGVEVTDVLPPGLALEATTPSQGTFDASTGTWTVGTVPLSGSATLSLTATLTAPGPLTNLAVKTAQAEPDSRSSNDSGGVMLTAVPSADIAVDKDVDRSAALVGENVTFTVRVTNRGPSPATSVAVADALPAGLALVSATSSLGTYSGGTWTVGNLAASDEATLTIVGTLTQAGPIVNQASVSASDQVDPNALNNIRAASVNAEANADILIGKAVSHAAPTVGTIVTYTVAATNLGPSDATNVDVLDILPAGVSLVSAAATSGFYDQATGFWTVGPLPQTRTAILTITATVMQGGTIDNTATRQTSVPLDPNSANDSATAQIVPRFEADLALTKTPTTPMATAGAPLTWTIVVTNNGPSPAIGATVTDTFHPAFLLPAWTCSASAGSSCGSGSGTGHLAATVSLAASGTATFTVTGTVDPSATTSLSNTAWVAAPSGTTDPVSSNDSATSMVTIGVVADLQVTKTGPSMARPRTTIAYTITVTNAGPASAPSVTVDDPTPAGLTFAGNTGACTTPFPCALGTLAPGETRTITASYTVSSTPTPSMVITNTATVTSAVPDAAPANSASSVATQVRRITSCDVDGDGTDELVTGAGPGGGPHVRVWNVVPPLTSELTGFYAYSPYFGGGVTVACRDVTGDGMAEIITGAGPGGGPHVRVWQYTPVGQTVTELTGFWAYSPYFAGGVRVAAADVTGDGIAEIITGAGPGGGPHVRAWQVTGTTVTEFTGFWGDAPTVSTGMFVGAGDVDGDGVAEIVSGPGAGSEPIVRVWSVASGLYQLRAQFFAYDPAFPGGASVTIGDLDGDGIAEVITGAGPGGGPHVRVWRITGGTATEVFGFFAYSPYFPGGTYVAAGDMDGDGIDELITGAGPGGGPHARVWKLTNGVITEVTGWFAYHPAFPGGTFVGR